MNSFDSFFAQSLAKRILEQREADVHAVLNGLQPDAYHQKIGAHRAYALVLEMMHEVMREMMSPDPGAKKS